MISTLVVAQLLQQASGGECTYILYMTSDQLDRTVCQVLS